MDEWISATRCWSPSPSPDGTTIAFVWDGDGRPQVRMHRRATGEEWSLDTGDELVSTVRWSPDGLWLAIETAPDGGERSNVSIVRPDGSDLRPVRGVGDADRGAVTLDRFTHTGSVLAITESDYDTTTAWLVDAESSQRQRVGSGHALQILDVSRDRRRVLLRRGRRGSRHVGIVDLDGTEGWHEIDSGRGPGGPPGAVEHPVAITRDSTVVAGRFCPDGTQMYLLTDGGRERAALVRVDVATDARPMTPEVLAERLDAELERFALTEDATVAALVWNAEGRSEVDLLDISSGKSGAYAPPGDVVTSAVFSHDGDSLVMGIQAPEVPAAVWCHELSSDTTALICPQEEPSWSPGQLVHPTLEVVTTPDGLRAARVALPAAGPVGAAAHGDLPARGARGAGAPRVHPALPAPARPGHRRLRGQRARLLGVRALVRQRRQRRGTLRGDPRRRDVRRAPRRHQASPIPRGSASWAAPTAAT